jgi:3-deoxy-7-phosphoheptulonate synthase
MIIVMRSDATAEHVDAVNDHLAELGLTANISRGAERTLIGAIGDDRKISSEAIET